LAANRRFVSANAWLHGSGRSDHAGGCAWLEIARLAWNLGKWVAQLSLPAEVVRWEWKRFRQAFVVVPAQVLRRAAQIWLRVSGSHRFARE